MSRTSRRMLAIGPLSARSAAMPHYLANGADFGDVAHDRWCNARMPAMSQVDTSRLAMLAPPARAGSLAAFALPSKGSGC